MKLNYKKMNLGLAMILIIGLSAFKTLDEPANFAGLWLLDVQKSVAPETAVSKSGKTLIRVIQQQPLLIIEKSLTDSTGKTMKATDTITFNQTKYLPVENGQTLERVMSQGWSADQQVMTITSKYKINTEGESVEFNGTETWKLSADGKVLTIVSETVLPDRTDMVTLVYNKQ